MVKKKGSLHLTGRNASLFATSHTQRSVISPSFFRSCTLDGDTADLKKVVLNRKPLGLRLS